MGHKHLFEQMAEPVDVLVNLINPAHSLVLVFDQCPPFSHHLDHHLNFCTGYIDTSLIGDNANNTSIILPHNV